MNEYLNFNLVGDIGSFSTFNTTTTLNFATKSSVVGLIASAMGISKFDHKRLSILSNGISYSVKVLYNKQGKFHDFNSFSSYPQSNLNKFVKCYKRLPNSRHEEMNKITDHNSSIFYKEYLLDVYQSVSIKTSGDGVNLRDIADSLKKPKFHLYLGKKCCVLSHPLMPEILKSENFMGSFIGIDKLDFKHSVLYSEDAEGLTPSRTDSYRIFSSFEGVKSFKKRPIHVFL